MVIVLTLIPTAVAILYIIYEQMPLLGIVAGYGVLVSSIALLRSGKARVEVSPDLQIKSTNSSKVHPELFKMTAIVNIVFFVESLMIYLSFSK